MSQKLCSSENSQTPQQMKTGKQTELPEIHGSAITLKLAGSNLSLCSRVGDTLQLARDEAAERRVAEHCPACACWIIWVSGVAMLRSASNSK